MTRPTLSVVVPCLNEEESLPVLVERLTAVLEGLEISAWEVFLVDDGSTDATLQAMRAAHEKDPRFHYLSFSRNFGHEAASTAGIAHARGEAVVLIDADLQDPPELIAEMVERWRQGADIVYATRASRAGESRFKLLTAAAFYRLLARMTSVSLPVDTGDFRLMSRPAVDAFLRMPERNRFVRGMVAWSGFKTAKVTYHRDARLAGETKYGPIKLALLAFDAMTAFSTVPLQLASFAGLGVTGLAVLGALVVTAQKLFFGLDVPGYAFQMVGIFFLGGVQLLILGIMGAYVGRIYVEVQRRPLYLVAESSRETFRNPGSPTTPPPPQRG